MASPFWTPCAQVLGAKLVLPTKTTYARLPMHPSGWFTCARHITTQLLVGNPALHSLLRVVTDNAIQEQSEENAVLSERAAKKPKITKSLKAPVSSAKKIRLYPTVRQREVLNQWFGTARWTYNQCVAATEKQIVPIRKEDLRKHCVYASAPIVTTTPWVCKTPQSIRDEALCDVLKAYKTAFALKKSGVTTHFKMNFRTLKAPSQSIVIHSRDWKDTKQIFLPTAFKKRGAETSLRTSEELPGKIEYDCRLQRTRLGHYYFCLLLPIASSETQAHAIPDPAVPPRILSIDPGVRTFLTGYEPTTGDYVEWGKSDIERIERLCVHLDDLISRTVRSKVCRQRYKMRKAQMRMRLKIRNLIDDFHKKLVNWLVHAYELVLLPTFETSRMVVKEHRKISRPSVRAMLTWAFYRFKQRLLMKAKMLGDQCHVIIIDEHHTTMTCGECGCLNRNVGGAKVFDCPTCFTQLPRDWNAARNIFLRFVSTSTWGPSLPGLSLGSAV